MSTRTVLLVAKDVRMRREIAGALWSDGLDVEIVASLGELAERLAGVPLTGAPPNAIVWDAAMGGLAAVDAVWRRCCSTVPQLVAFGDGLEEGPEVAPRFGIELAGIEVGDVVAAVRRALPASKC